MNKLRSNANESTTDNPVLRWKVVGTEGQSRPNHKSYSQAIATTASEARPDAAANVVRQPQSQTQPKSSAHSSITIGDRGVTLASHNSGSAESNPSSSATSVGVWYDRSAASIGTSSNPVQRTRFQDAGDVMPETTPPGLQLPPAATDEPALIPQELANPGLDLSQEIPSPFPKPKTQEPEILDSPSDAIEPPPMSRRDDQDRAPKPPRRPNRSSVDCDSIRQLAKDQQDISQIRIDSSPNFVEGYRGKNQKNQNTKQGFLDSAEVRTWYNYDGIVIAEGKLVDIERGMVIIEREDGSRESSLLRKLSDSDNAYISQVWGVPVTCSIEDRSFPSRDFLETTMTFKASGACHKPLYFEEVQLERYGHEWGPVAQPVLSTAHFFGSVAVLPYKMGIHPMNECQYALGYYRPGSCAPWTVGPVPISLRGALMQANAVTGMAWALP